MGVASGFKFFRFGECFGTIKCHEISASRIANFEVGGTTIEDID